MAGVGTGLLSRGTRCVEPVASASLELLPKLSFFLSVGGLLFLSSLVGVFVLFLIHQASLWLSQDPEKAFHAARTTVDVGSQIYDTYASLANSFNEVFVQVIPAWNAYTRYAIQPVVFAGLEILSIAFADRPYTGVLTEENFGFEGHRCPEDGSVGVSAAWCGSVAAYSSKLGYSTGSNSFVANDSLVLSSAAGRRLSESMGRPLIPILDLSALTDGLQGVVAAGIVVGGSISDLFFHVAFEIVSLIFRPILKFALQLFESLGAAMFTAFKPDRRGRRASLDDATGTFTEIVTYGLDLLLILVTEVAIPLLFALIDSFMCMLDLFRPNLWGVQLQCIARACWQPGSDVMADTFHLFSSIPPVAGAIERVFAKTVNSVTGQRFSSKASGGAGLPDLGDSGSGTPQAEVCAACFTCKVCIRPARCHTQPSTRLAAPVSRTGSRTTHRLDRQRPDRRLHTRRRQIRGRGRKPLSSRRRVLRGHAVRPAGDGHRRVV